MHCVPLFQSHQARIATLYLPLFGLLIENVQRINVRDVSPFPVNPGSVRKHIHLGTVCIRPCGCPNQVTRTGWPKTTELHSFTVRRPEVRNQGIRRIGPFWRLHVKRLFHASLTASSGCPKSLRSLACGHVVTVSASTFTGPPPWRVSGSLMSSSFLTVIGYRPPNPG